MKIIQATHLHLDGNRMVWYLRNDRDQFVDLFDLNLETNKIRFYGTEKEIDPEKVSVKKQKQWHISNFNDLIRREFYGK